MNAESLPHPMTVVGPSDPNAALAALRDLWRSLAQRCRAWLALQADRRGQRRIERDLAHLSLHTLKDIGAPPSLIGRRRALDQLEAEQCSLERRLRG